MLKSLFAYFKPFHKKLPANLFISYYGTHNAPSSGIYLVFREFLYKSPGKYIHNLINKIHLSYSPKPFHCYFSQPIL